MPHRLIWRDLLRGGLALGVAPISPTARACEFFSSALRITHPWTCASDPATTTALLSMRFDEISQDDRLVQVHRPVAAAAEMGGIALTASASASSTGAGDRKSVV